MLHVRWSLLHDLLPKVNRTYWRTVRLRVWYRHTLWCYTHLCRVLVRHNQELTLVFHASVVWAPFSRESLSTAFSAWISYLCDNRRVQNEHPNCVSRCTKRISTEAGDGDSMQSVIGLDLVWTRTGRHWGRGRDGWSDISERLSGEQSGRRQRDVRVVRQRSGAAGRCGDALSLRAASGSVCPEPVTIRAGDCSCRSRPVVVAERCDVRTMEAEE